MSTHSIAGTISGSLSGVVVTAGGDDATSSGGSYTIPAATDGLVEVIPQLAGYRFSPDKYVFNLAANTTGIDFTATATGIYACHFHLRCKNSGGTVQATFSPAAGVGVQVEPGRGEQVRIEREGLDYSTDHYHIGFRQRVKATFMSEGKSIAAAGGYSTLEAVLNAMAAGSYLEYNIIDASAGGVNWVPCELDGDGEISRPNEKNVAKQFTIELVSKSAAVSTAFPVS